MKHTFGEFVDCCSSISASQFILVLLFNCDSLPEIVKCCFPTLRSCFALSCICCSIFLLSHLSEQWLSQKHRITNRIGVYSFSGFLAPPPLYQPASVYIFFFPWCSCRRVLLLICMQCTVRLVYLTLVFSTNLVQLRKGGEVDYVFLIFAFVFLPGVGPPHLSQLTCYHFWWCFSFFV